MQSPVRVPGDVRVKGKMSGLIDMNENSRENKGIDSRRERWAERSTLLLLWVEVKGH